MLQGAAGLALSLLARNLLAGPGDFDPSFGMGGVAIRDFGDRDAIHAVFALPEGGVLVSGTAEKAGVPAGLVARLKATGMPDESFGNAGLVTLEELDAASVLALQPDGRVLVGGPSRYGVVLARLDARGALDATFGDGGWVALPLARRGMPSSLRSLLPLPDGRILVLALVAETDGDSLLMRCALARLDSSGRPDRTFGAGGRVVFSLASKSRFDSPAAVALQADGKIVIAGSTATERRGATAVGVVRLQPDGSLDVSFGSGGRIRATYGGTSSGVTALVALPGGKLLVAGRRGGKSRRVSGAASLLRLAADGTPDVSFGTAGLAEWSLPDTDLELGGAAVRRDGKILVAARARVENQPDRVVLAEFTAAGALDQAFAGTGWTKIPNLEGDARALALEDEGRKVLVAGSTLKDAFVARFLAGPLECGAASPSAQATGAVTMCPGGTAKIQAVLAGTPPWDLVWSDGFRQRNVTASPAERTVRPVATTRYSVAFVGDATGCGTAAGETVVTLEPPPPPPVTAAARASAGVSGLLASVPDHPGSSYGWRVTGGTLTVGQGSSRVTFQAGYPGTIWLSVVETTAGGCVTPAGQASVTVGSQSELFLSRGRVRVAVRYRNPYTGEIGDAGQIAQRDDSGLFHFGNPTDPEVLVKVLDFGPSKPYQLFHAGITDFEYTVTYTVVSTGQSVQLVKPAGSLQAGFDATSLLRGPDEVPAVFAPSETKPGAASVTSVDLSQGRVRVSVTYRNPGTGQTASAPVVPRKGSWALFHFGDPDNPEVFVKVLDFGEDRPFIALHAGVTDVEYAVTYTVLKSGKTVTLTKKAGTFGAGSDGTGLTR